MTNIRQPRRRNVHVAISDGSSAKAPNRSKQALERLPGEAQGQQTPTGNKFGARRTWVEAIGRHFASKREAEAALALWARQQAGEVRDLFFQVPYDFYFDGEKLGRYVADFVYDERRPQWDTSMGEAWVRVVADAKGVQTPVYRIKKKLMKAFYGIDIVEL